MVGASQFTRCGCHGAHGPERPRRGGVITGSGKHTPPNQRQLPDALPRGSGLQLRREEQHFMTASLAGEKPGQNLPPAQGPLLPASSAALARLRLPGLPGGKAVPPQRFPDRPAAPQCATPDSKCTFWASPGAATSAPQDRHMLLLRQHSRVTLTFSPTSL